MGEDVRTSCRQLECVFFSIGGGGGRMYNPASVISKRIPYFFVRRAKFYNRNSYSLVLLHGDM